MNLNYFYILFFSLLIIINCKSKFKDVFKEGNEKAEKIMYEMKLHKKEIWLKKDFENFFLKLLDKGDNNERQKIFNEQIVKTYIKKLPKEMKKIELYKYMNYDDFITAIEQTVREQFGEEHVKDVTQALLEMEKEEEEDNKINNNNNKKNNSNNEDILNMDEIDKDL